MQPKLINQFTISLRNKLKNGRPPEEIMELCATHFERRGEKPNYYYYILMGEANSKLGKFKEAVFLFTRALQEKQTAEVYAFLGKEYYKKGSLKQVVLFIQKAIDIDSENLDILTILGEVYIDLGKNKDIFNLLEKLDKKAPLNKSSRKIATGLRANLSKLAMKKRKFPLALKISRQGIEKDNRNFIHHESLGISLLQMGEYKEALKYLEISRSLNPLSSKCPMSGYGEKKKEAGSINKKINEIEVELGKEDHKDSGGEKHFDLGFLYYYNGEHRKALKTFHRALDLKISDAC